MMLTEMVGKHGILHGANERPTGSQIGHAHYNRTQGYGIEVKHPDADQFFTILRDPFDRLVSWYFYIKHLWKGEVWGIRLVDYGNTLNGFLDGYHPDVLNFLPAGDYPARLDDFVFVGTVERLWDGARALAEILGKPVPQLRRANGAKRDEPVPNDMRPEFRRRYPDVYEVHDYAMRTWSPLWDKYRKP